MDLLLQLLEHLVVAGPARNPAELEHLLGLIEELRQRHTAPAAPTPPAQNAPQQTSGAVNVSYPPGGVNVSYPPAEQTPGGSL